VKQTNPPGPLDRIPPQVLDSEQAVLGALILAGNVGLEAALEALGAAEELLAAGDFYRTEHRLIYAAIQDIVGEAETPDLLAVAEALEAAGSLEQVQGKPYLLACLHAAATPTAAYVRQHARRIWETAAKRRIIDLSGQLIGAAYNGRTVEELAEEAQTFGAALQPRGQIPQGISAAELIRKRLSPPKWAVSRLFPAGMTLLAGSPKLGKSWIALQAGIAIASGGKALGKIDVEQGDVLYLALEDTEWRLQGRLQLLLNDSPAPEALDLHLSWPAMNDGGTGAIDAWLKLRPRARLVIIDTLGKFRGMPDPKEAVYYSDTDASSKIKRIADRHGVSVVVIHHTNKRKVEDIFESVSGSHGLGGAADGTVVLQRKRMDDIAILHVTGRDVQEDQLGLKWEDHVGWYYTGDAKDLLRTEAEKKVLAAFRSVGGGSLRAGEVASKLNQSVNTARVQLHRMRDKGILVSRDGLWTPANPTFADTLPAEGTSKHTPEIGNAGS